MIHRGAVGASTLRLMENDAPETVTDTGQGAPAAAASVPDVPEASPSLANDERWAGDPNRYVDVDGTVEKAGEVVVVVGEFAGSIIKAEVRTADGLVEVDSFDATDVNVGAAQVTARSKSLTSGKATLRLTIPAD